jgi:osmotically-inducible protein OsmY
MKSSEESRRQAEQHLKQSEQKLIDDHETDTQDDEPGFDRARQGAPRSDDASRYSGQSAYGSLEKPAPPDELANTNHARTPGSQKGDFGEGNYGGERGQSERGGLSSYGNSSGSRYVIDNQANTSSRTQTPELSRPGSAPGAASQSNNIGRYAGEYDDNVAPEQSEPIAASRNALSHPGAEAAPTQPLDSDRRIHGEIAERLLEHGQLEVRDISLTVSGGAVTLKGTVPEKRFSQTIEALADNVDGVIKIDNQIEVRRLEDQSVNFGSSHVDQKPGSTLVDSTTPTDTGPATFGAASGSAEMKKHQQKEPDGLEQEAGK